MRKLFVHGRPTGHPLHMKYGETVCDEITVEDPWLRWHDKDFPAPIRYVAWLINALSFVTFRRTLILTEGLRITIVLAKMLSLGNIKLIALVDDESPYFIKSGYYGRLSRWVNSWAYRQYDSFVCIGPMETTLIQSIVRRKDNIFTGFNGVSLKRRKELALIQPALGTTNLVFIGSCAAPWRAWYKGLDLVLDAFQYLLNQQMDLRLTVVGYCPDVTRKFLEPYVRQNNDRVIFTGQVEDIGAVLGRADVMVHPGRGEAWGISVLEAMMAGVVPVVSNYTGVAECVCQVSTECVVPPQAEAVALAVKRLLMLSPDTRRKLSDRCREVAKPYTEEDAIARFQECFSQAKG